MKRTKENYVDFDQARLLKELGFNLPVTHCYWNKFQPNPIGHGDHIWSDIGQEISVGDLYWNDNDSKDMYSAPTYYQVQRWLEDEYHIDFNSNYNNGYTMGLPNDTGWWWYFVSTNEPEDFEGVVDDKLYESRSEALKYGITAVLNHIKENGKSVEKLQRKSEKCTRRSPIISSGISGSEEEI